MARRPGGKAASRRSRQRRAQRPAPPPSVAATPQPLEEAGLEERPEDPREEPRKASAVSAPSAARAYAGSGSSLTERERAEYHYVERDLRNIGILTAIMFVLLIAAWFVFNALGLVS
jgi:hypothetical protein